MQESDLPALDPLEETDHPRGERGSDDREHDEEHQVDTGVGPFSIVEPEQRPAVLGDPARGQTDGDPDQALPGRHLLEEVNETFDRPFYPVWSHDLWGEDFAAVGFTDPLDDNAFCWNAQPLALEYEPSRSDAPNQPVNCLRTITAGTCWSDPTLPPSGGVFYYLVRALCGWTGSLGADSSGGEHVWGCENLFPGCLD